MVDQLYILDGGTAIAPDRSVYTPGLWENEAINLPCHVYLIKHGDDWIIWDTGIKETLISEPDGLIIAHNIKGVVTKTIRAQLAEIGLLPQDISKVMLSHAHFDHIGNAELFAHATWYMQQAEYDAMFGGEHEKYGFVRSFYECLSDTTFKTVTGDFDVFGDDSVRIISTPGHTPGHSSLLVRLPQTGTVILSGDVAHYEYNFMHECVPQFNSDQQKSKESIKRIRSIVQEENAVLWLNHDAAQSGTLSKAPSFFE